MTSTLPPLIQAFSGSIGSAAANTTVYPLDLVTTRLQTSRSKHVRGIKGALYLLHQIIHKHGLGGLYDGFSTDTGETIISGFLYYYVYSFLCSLLLRRQSISSSARSKISTLSVTKELGIGFVAGVASKLISTPLRVVTTRLQTERDDKEANEDMDGDAFEDTVEEMRTTGGVRGVVERIYADEGLAGFWRGFASTIPLALSPSLTLFLFQIFRRVFLPRQNRERPTPAQAFIGGAIAQSIATICLYPLMLAKTQIQTTHASPPQSSPLSTQSRNEVLMILKIWQAALAREGPKGLYQGIEAQLVKGVVSQGVALMVKTRIEQLLVGMYLKRIGRAYLPTVDVLLYVFA